MCPPGPRVFSRAHGPRVERAAGSRPLWRRLLPRPPLAGDLGHRLGDLPVVEVDRDEDGPDAGAGGRAERGERLDPRPGRVSQVCS